MEVNLGTIHLVQWSTFFPQFYHIFIFSPDLSSIAKASCLSKNKLRHKLMILNRLFSPVLFPDAYQLKHIEQYQLNPCCLYMLYAIAIFLNIFWLAQSRSYKSFQYFDDGLLKNYQVLCLCVGHLWSEQSEPALSSLSLSQWSSLRKRSCHIDLTNLIRNCPINPQPLHSSFLLFRCQKHLGCQFPLRFISTWQDQLQTWIRAAVETFLRWDFQSQVQLLSHLQHFCQDIFNQMLPIQAF